MLDAVIKLTNDDQDTFLVGDTVSGTAEVTLSNDIPLLNVALVFNSVGEVKWVEPPGTPYFINGHVYYDQFNYFEKGLPFSEEDAKITPDEGNAEFRKVSIPFTFVIPKGENLPSTMNSPDGFIKYFLKVSIKLGEEEVKEFTHELNVLAPFDSVENLAVSICGSVEKTVLLHGGNVKLRASIDRKGYAPGEDIPVQVTIENGCNAKLGLRVSLQQIQIFMSGPRHKTVDNILSETRDDEDGDEGYGVEPNNTFDQLIEVKVPEGSSLSIKSPIITVKYFVNVSLDIPQSFDLHLNLPVVITDQSLVKQVLQSKE